MANSKRELGQILVGAGIMDQAALGKAVQGAKDAGKRLDIYLCEQGEVPDHKVAKALAQQLGLRYADPNEQKVAARIDSKDAPEELVRKHFFLPLGKSGGKLRLLMHDPMDLELLDLLRFRLNTEIEPIVGAKSRIKEYIENAMGGSKPIAPTESLVTESIDQTVDKSVDASIDKADADAPIIKLCNRILGEAVTMRASDIHVEPMEDRIRLRYRIDGVCIERDNLPKRMQKAVLARMKLMSGMNIAERRVPQDGRIKLPVRNEKTNEIDQIDFRVSACPAYHGESVVLRILRPESVRIGLTNIGFEPDTLETFNKIIRKPNGIFLVTGPTGSGKTTTLYSALDILNRPDRKIITAEDPVEYAFAGINQCQVRDDIGLSFSSILRAMLRQAPNVILVGEIRDKAVADVAIQAALTGHLVFSTLHTNDAAGAMTRLVDMGVKPFLAASSIQAVLAQRLVRVLCDKCKVPDPAPDPKYLRLLGITEAEMATATFYKPNGCDVCSRTGFKGRKGIFELLELNAEIRELAFNRAPAMQIKQAAVAAGMRTLLGDGKIKVLNGITTAAEIARVAQSEDDAQAEDDPAVAMA